MSDKKNGVSTEEQPVRLPDEWQQRAHEAARRFDIPDSNDADVGSAAEAEQRLRQFEQEGGQ